MPVDQSNKQLFEQIGATIRQLRVSQCLSQAELTVRCDIEASQVNAIEMGEVDLDICSLYAIAKALGVEAKELLDIDKSEPKL